MRAQAKALQGHWTLHGTFFRVNLHLDQKTVVDRGEHDDTSLALSLLVQHGCLVESYGQVAWEGVGRFLSLQTDTLRPTRFLDFYGVCFVGSGAAGGSNRSRRIHCSASTSGRKVEDVEGDLQPRVETLQV